MKPDDGLIAPAGYEIVRWPDGSPKFVDTRNCERDNHWLSNDYEPAAMKGRMNGVSPYSYYRIALHKLPEKKLLNFREAVAAHRLCNSILCVGEPNFRWGRANPIAYINGSTVGYEWMFDRTDFYVENPT